MIKEYFKYNHHQPSHDLPSHNQPPSSQNNKIKREKKKINFILKPSYGNKGDDMIRDERCVDW